MSIRKYVSKRRKKVELSPGLYFLYTIPYGIYYLIGAGVGYSRKESLLCLLLGGSLGVIIFFLGVGHVIEHYRGIPIEHFYLVLPMLFSMVVAILMTCFYALGAKFMPSGFVGMVGWISFAFYAYASIREFGHKVVDAGARYNSQMQLRYSQVKSDSSFFVDDDKALL